MEHIIIKKAHQLFACYGIKSITMSQISKELQISKKTLYEYFDNKEELVYRVVETTISKLTAELDRDVSVEDSPVKKTLIYGNKIFDYLNSFCPAYHREVKYFQKASHLLQEKQETFYKQSIRNLEEGQLEGYFIKEGTERTISGVCYYLVSTIYKESLDNQYKYVPEMIITFLRGICTEKGLIELSQAVTCTQSKVSLYY